MKILLYGDSITDMCRNRGDAPEVYRYGSGYPMFVASALYREDPVKYQVVNRGVGGNKIVDLYARVKSDVWNEKPDVLSILIGINDIWHEIARCDGVEPERFEKVYDMLIEETLQHLPNLKIMLCEPFVLKGSATEEQFDKFTEIYKRAKIVKKLADKYKLYYLPLQEKFDAAAKKFGAEKYLYDGVHPDVAGATLIADEWIKLFKDKVI